MVSSTLSPAHKSSVTSKWNGLIRNIRESIAAVSPSQLVDHVLSRERVVSGLSPKEMLQRSKELTVRARSEKKLWRLIPDAFSLVREAAYREFGYRHYPVQILGGVHLAQDRIIEMETGQGKSITALFPLYLYGLLGKGAHLATSNDYLAERDAKTMANVFRQLGLSCGFINGDMKPDQRRINYGYDITYGTGTEFGFDFLRDRIATPSRASTPSHVTQTNSCVQRGRFFILADEADSLLIDDANTPLILGTAGNPQFALEELCHWSVRIARRLILDHDYERSKIDRSFRLTRDGRSKVRGLANGSQVSNHYSMFDVFDYVEKALFAQNCMHREKQYIVREKEIVLVQENTGRLGEGRQLQAGLHQIIQAIEGVPVTPPNEYSARITVQGFFMSYRHLAGMTGTGLSAANEFQKVYGRSVVRIPTHRPSLRMALPNCSTESMKEKWELICRETDDLQKQGRAILIGTRSIQKSEELSARLTEWGVSHKTLNAKNHAEEAAIIAKAGESGSVTVATGMAGRGTDIKLAPSVKEAGGLHVILSELHDSIRSDQQMYGRCARQGDPGSHRTYFSREDDLLVSAMTCSEKSKMSRRIRIGELDQAMLKAQFHHEAKQSKMRIAQFEHERKRLESIIQMGLDPVLDALV
jgi:preprotein translocase subunit SecA